MATVAEDKAIDGALRDDVAGENYVPEGEKAKDVKNTMILTPGEGQEMGKEVVVVKTWEDGTIYFIDPDHLDTIDRKRLLRALQRADKSGVELWTVLKDTQLSNGSNALDYFHQLVQTHKPAGANKAPTAARINQALTRDRDLAVERAGPEMIGVSNAGGLLGRR